MFVAVAVLSIVAVSGCHQVAQDTTTFNRYYMTSLEVSTSADVIPMIGAKDESLTQGENAVVSWGETKEGSVIFFNAVAFDDTTSRAIRKYAFVANPKAKGFGCNAVQTMRFDAELVINPNVINEPYANDNARKIAIMKSVLADFTSDLTPLIKDGKTLNSSLLMVKQLMKGLIYHLDASPALAANLQNITGMKFDHMTLDAGKTRMLIDGDIVKLKVMTGCAVHSFDKRLDVAGM